MATLFEIGAELAALVQLVETSDHDLDDPEAVETLEQWFKEIEANEGVKIDHYIGLIRQWEMEAAAQKEEAERFAKAATVRANRIERLKKRALEYLDGTGRKSIMSARGRTIAAQNNGGILPIIPAGWEETVKLSDFPEFTKTVLDTAAVRKALDAGRKLPFASFGPRGRHVRIK